MVCESFVNKMFQRTDLIVNIKADRKTGAFRGVNK